MSTRVDAKTEVLGRIAARHAKIPVRSVLVVGCGAGQECVVLAELLGADVFGVDPYAEFATLGSCSHRVTLHRDTAENLHYASGSFDVAYSYHALEHFANTHAALEEMRRVLRSGGLLVVGTPNASRLVGYLSSSASVGDAWRWNLSDWRARVGGRFTNELGAHAGFTARQLEAMLGDVFHDVRCVSAEYYDGVYPKWGRAVSLLEATHASSFAYPSVYFVATAD